MKITPATVSKLLPGLVLAFWLALNAGPAFAASYTVDPAQPTSATNFHSLDDLRAASITWADGDSITLLASDASLTEAFNFGTAQVTINGGEFKITPQTPNSYRFASGGGFTLSGVSLSGFKHDGGGGDGQGGAIYSAGGVNLSGGANTFSANSASGGGIGIGQGGAIYSAGGVNLSGGANTFSGNNASGGAGGAGGAIYSAGAVNLSGGANTFSANSASIVGGAIYSAGGVNLSGGANTFSANSARGGGAIYSAGTVHLSGGANSFNGNSADGLGGAISGATAISGGTNIFSGNSAIGGGIGLGGAISGATAISGGANTFNGNSADGGGGAISGATTISGGTNIFSGNSGGGGGGAINGATTISGGVNSFVNNQAGSLGGAIDTYYGASLAAKDGDLVFAGNRDNAGAAGEKANALHAGNNAGTDTLSLAANAGRGIYFYDPVTSNSAQPGLTIAINSGAGHNGRVVLDGSRWTNAADKLSAVHGNTTVYNGTLALKGGAVYGTAANTGGFTLNTGAVLASGVGSAIYCGTLETNANHTLAFDLSGALNTGDASPTTNLLFNNQGASISNTYKVDILSFAGASGAYWLAALNNGQFDISQADLLTRGEPLANTRASGATLALIQTTNPNDTLVLTGAPANGVVIWTGTAGDNLWNASSANWDTSTSGLGSSGKFLHGDAAVFAGAGATVQVQDGRAGQGTGVQVQGRTVLAVDYPAMTVNGGNWTFTGGAIESVDGQVMELKGGAVVSFANQTIAGADSGSRTMHQHVRVPADQTATLLAAPGATLNFTGMKALSAAPENGYGGAVYAGPGASLTLGGASSGAINFAGNTAASFGGAIVCYNLTISGGGNSFMANSAGPTGSGGAIAGNNVILSGGANSFMANTAYAGGAVYGSNVTLSDGASTFTANTADAGGAIVGNNVILSGGANSFMANTAVNGAGGAISSDNNLTISGGSNTFMANTAVNGAGGAIAGNNVILSGGSNSFMANSSGGRGGAIYIEQNGTLIANGGDITFRGNTANGAPNALYAHNIMGSKTLALAAKAGHAIFFHDPISSNDTRTNLTVNINQGADNSGTVLFDRYHSEVHGSTTLHNGTMQLTGGAHYGAGSTAGSFTVKRITDGAGLLADVGGNRILANTIALEDGAKISADMRGAVAQGQPGGTTNLVLEGGVSMSAGVAKLTVDALHAGAFNGRYYLISASNGFAFSEANVKGLFDGGPYVAPNPRYGDAAYSFTTLGVVAIDVSGADISRTATWTNATGNGLWNMTSQNWSLSPAPGPGLDGWFKDGDDVIFAGAGQGEVVADAAGVAPNHMTVSGGEYAFAGGAISGASLDLSGGRAVLATDTSFAEIDVRGGATMGLAATGSINKGAIAVTSHFILHSGASLLVEPGAAPLTINAETITLQSGSTVGLQGFGYGPVLAKGQYTALTLGGTTITNNSSLLATSGTIQQGASNYSFSNLRWSADGSELLMDVTGSSPDPQRSGSGAITGSSHIGAMNPAFNVFSYHSRGLFGPWNNLPQTSDYSQGALQYARAANGSASDGAYLAAGENSGSKYLNRLWVTPNYVNVNQSAGDTNVGYNLQTPGFAFGYDRQLCENAFVGAGVSVSWPDYTGGGTDINAQDITFALYGGYRLPYAIELDAHAGFGFTRYDQDREVQAERYSNKYNGQNFFAGLGIGRPFALGSGFAVRPGLAYDFIHLSTDGFDEGQGTYALKADDYTQDIHRVKAGVDVSWTEQKSGFVASGEVYYLGVYGDRDARASAHFVNDPVNGFTMLGNGLDQDNLGLGVNVSLPVSERWEVGAGYNVLLGSDTVSQQGMLNATFKF